MPRPVSVFVAILPLRETSVARIVSLPSVSPVVIPLRLSTPPVVVRIAPHVVAAEFIPASVSPSEIVAIFVPPPNIVSSTLSVEVIPWRVLSVIPRLPRPAPTLSVRLIASPVSASLSIVPPFLSASIAAVVRPLGAIVSPSCLSSLPLFDQTLRR
jgi:hypothetical protein